MNNTLRRVHGYDGFVWRDLFDSFDEVFRAVCEAPSRLNSNITSNNFPPSDIIVDKVTKQLRIRVALAGYSQKDLFVEFDDDLLKVKINRQTEDTESEKPNLVIQRGIKLPKTAEINFRIDTRFYDSGSSKVSFEDGLLTVRIDPLEQVKPRKIALFGEDQKALEDKKEEKTE